MLRDRLRRLQINSSRVHLDAFAREAGASVAAGTRVLDAGAGNVPYRDHFAHTTYESADFCELDKAYAPMTYVCDLTAIPTADGRFDLVFCSQTLEHVPEPQRVLAELHRVLRPGGRLWLSAPLFYEEHEVPYDFFRYTRYGLARLLESVGFEVERVTWLEGYYGTLAHQLRRASQWLPLRPRHYGGGLVGLAAVVGVAALKPLFAVVALALSRLDLRHQFVDAGLCKNYTVVAHKPATLTG